MMWDLPPIDPQFNPRKKLEVSRKKDRTGSSIEQDPLNDWDFDAQADQDEGPASAEHSLSPILMSSQSNHAGLKQPSSLAPTSVGSSSFSGIKSGWSDDDWSTLPKESSGLGFKAQSASVLASTPARTISTSAIAAKDWSNDESFSPTKSKSSNGSRSRSISRTSGTTTAPLGSSYTPKKDWSKDDLDWRKTSPCSSPLNRRNSPPRLLPSRTNTTPYMELSDDSDNNPGLPSMRDLIGRSLSPPTIFHDDSENTEEEDLMEDVFANNSKRKGKGLKKSLSATRLSQSKKRPRATSPDLQEWGMSDSDAGYNSLSMEAIVAKRTKKRAGFVDDDSDLDEKKEAQKKAKATELALKKAAKDAALQQKREEREKAKSIREEAQQRKRELKEQGRLAKEEDRLAEKRAARDIRIANRLTTKSDSVKEMILCMEDSLLRTSFGQAVEDYLKEVESHIHKQKTTDERAGAGGTGSTPSEQSIMFWRRTVVRRYDEEQDQFIFLPGGKPEISLEPFALVYITGGDFAAMIEQGRLRQELAILKQEMKIRKNKEMMKQQSQNLKLRDLRLQRQRVIYLINGLEEYLRKLKRVKHKNYQQRVLENLGQAPTGAARELTAEQDEEKIEQELLWLQLEQDCLVVQAANEEEAALNVVSLTEQIGLRPYKEARKSKLNICVEGIKSGSDPADTWIKSLQMIHMVTLNMAKAIAEKYPTIKSLYEGYRQCNTLTQAHNMLAEIQASRRVGPTVSRRIFDVFMSEDPNLPTTTAGSNRLAGNNSSQ
ncbi:putative monocarboxylate transporter mch1 [Gryganskiella cystojenkinii]|nr:putative monocarboxylate transporter mch1 [Gryganskiella cystojenkinii]